MSNYRLSQIVIVYTVHYELDSSSKTAYVLNYVITLLLSLIVIVTADVHTAYNTTRKEIILIDIYAIRVSLSRTVYYVHIVSEVHTHTHVRKYSLRFL